MDSIREAMAEPREGLHRSSLFPCARKGKALDYLRPELTDEEALFYAQGRAIHDFVVGERFRPLETALTMTFRNNDASVRVTALDTPDGWATLADGQRVPAEFKATRLSSARFPDRQEQTLGQYRGALGEYLRQLFDHCLWAGSKLGVLSILFFMGDYGFQRSKCPQCHSKVSDGVCESCPWEAKRTEMRTYRVDFSDEPFKDRERRVAAQVSEYVAAEQPLDVDPTPCWQCKTCRIGKTIGCEHAGRTYS